MPPDESDPLGRDPIAADSTGAASLPSLPDLDPSDAPRLRGQLQSAPRMVPEAPPAVAMLGSEPPPPQAFEIGAFEAPDDASTRSDVGPAYLEPAPIPFALGGAGCEECGALQVVTESEGPRLCLRCLMGTEPREGGTSAPLSPIGWAVLDHPLLGARPEPPPPHPWARFFRRTARDYRPFVPIAFFTGLLGFAATGWLWFLLVFWLSAMFSAVGVWVNRGDGTLD